MPGCYAYCSAQFCRATRRLKFDLPQGFIRFWLPFEQGASHRRALKPLALQLYRLAVVGVVVWLGRDLAVRRQHPACQSA